MNKTLFYLDQVIRLQINALFNDKDSNDIDFLEKFILFVNSLIPTLRSTEVILDEVELLRNISSIGSSLALFLRDEFFKKSQTRFELLELFLDLVENHNDVQTLTILYNSIIILREKVASAIRNNVFPTIKYLTSLGFHNLHIPRYMEFDLMKKIFQSERSQVEEYQQDITIYQTNPDEIGLGTIFNYTKSDGLLEIKKV